MHRLIGFKGFADAAIDLSRPLTVLIGRNGSGKSNLIEGVELLAAIVDGVPLSEITETGRGGALEVRGGLQSCPSFGRRDFTLGFSDTASIDGAPRGVEYRVTLGVDPVRIIAESLEVDGRSQFEARVEDDQDDLSLRVSDASGQVRTRARLPGGRSVLSQFDQLFRALSKAKAARTMEHVRDRLRRAFVFDPSPRAMRSYNRIGEGTLRRDGANLSAVLHAISRSYPDAIRRILGRVRSVPDAPVEDFEFVTTALGDVMFGLRERGRSALTDARLLSDGTLRAIAVLTALETADRGDRVVIEELDNGLHPSRVRALLDAIRGDETAGANERPRVLVTTHNPATLNELDETGLDAVVITARREPDGPAEVIRLRDVPRHDELLERGRLGDLVTDDVVRRYLEPRFEDERREAARAWLRGLGS